MDYTAGDLYYAAKYWGQLAQGSSIDLYEWVRSSISPIDWANSIVSGTAVNINGISVVPSGTVLNADNPAWTQTTESDVTGNTQTWYYFWVANTNLAPSNSDRSITTLSSSQMLTDPTGQGIIWWSVTGSQSLILANVSPILARDNNVARVIYGQNDVGQNEYKQWLLSRPNDPNNVIDSQFWSKMRDSLTGFDGLGNPVPDTNLHPLMRTGTQIRPRQSWFKDRLAAADAWITAVNSLLAKQSQPLTENVEITGWSSIVNSQEAVPSTGWVYQASSIAARNNLVTTGRVQAGDTVLVDSVPDTNGLWTLQTWDGTYWTVVQQQAYNTSRFWTYTDWYASGYDSSTPWKYVVPTSNDISSIYHQMPVREQ